MPAATATVPTRDRLVDTARAYLDQEGVDGIGLREIARRAGVSHGAPLRHFPTLGALLAAVAADGFRDLYASVDAAVRSGASDDPAGAAQGRGARLRRLRPRPSRRLRADVPRRSLRHVRPRLRDRGRHRVRSARRAGRRRAGRRAPSGAPGRRARGRRLGDGARARVAAPARRARPHHRPTRRRRPRRHRDHLPDPDHDEPRRTPSRSAAEASRCGASGRIPTRRCRAEQPT